MMGSKLDRILTAPAAFQDAGGILLYTKARTAGLACNGTANSTRRPDRFHGDVRTIADDGVHAPGEEPLDVTARVDGPDLHRQSGAMRVADEPRGDDGGAPGAFGHLEFTERGA